MKIINFYQILIFINGFSIYCSLNDDLNLKGLFVINRFNDLSFENYSPSICPNNLKNLQNFKSNDFRFINPSIKSKINDVGKYLKETHFTFDFDSKDLEIYNSDNYRSIQFTELILDGLLNENSNKLTNLDWIIDRSSDNCPEVLNEIEYPNDNYIYNNNKDLFQYLTNLCGTNITTIDQVNKIYKIWLNEMYAELKRPILNEYDFRLNEILKLISIKDQMQCSNMKSKRLKVGLFLNDILQKMQTIVQSKSIDLNRNETIKKAFIYSTDDVFFNCLMSTFGFDYGSYLPYGNNLINDRKYGSTIVIELHQCSECEFMNSSNDDINYFKIYYFDHDKLYVNMFPRLIISECPNDEFCELKYFKNKIKDFILDQDEWNDECKLSNTIETIQDPNLIFIILILISAILNFILIIAIFIFWKRSRFNLI